MQRKYDYILVGAGLSGLALAKELCKNNKKVLIVEKGNFVKSLGNIAYAALFYDRFALARSVQGTLIYRVFGVGGTSIVSCGNAVEPSEEGMDKIGIDLKEELNLAKKECSVNAEDFPIGKASTEIMMTANKLGHKTRIMPKFGAINRCNSCGGCALGCKYGAKWTAVELLKDIDKERVDIVPRFSVKKVLVSDREAIGIEGSKSNFMKKTFFADKTILCAGGIGTPIILQNSGIEAGENLFVDLFNVTYGFREGFNQTKEVAMAVVCDRYHQEGGFILSPFVDNIVGFFPSVEAKYIWKIFKLNKMLGIMTKIRDDNIGKVRKDGRIEKDPTPDDLEKLKKGSDIAKEILIKCGVDPKSILITKPRGAHPGGTAAIGKVVNNRLETQIKNLFICDASVLPYAPGIPPMLTLVALAKWFGKTIE
ncbi:MAG: GMC family oxidoreductase [Candidatus Omnitrophica bacterium]|nr:GMC family oxidoreductase [Candidatus Omnitrophota bacterium]